MQDEGSLIMSAYRLMKVGPLDVFCQGITRRSCTVRARPESSVVIPFVIIFALSYRHGQRQPKADLHLCFHFMQDLSYRDISEGGGLP